MGNGLPFMSQVGVQIPVGAGCLFGWIFAAGTTNSERKKSMLGLRDKS